MDEGDLAGVDAAFVQSVLRKLEDLQHDPVSALWVCCVRMCARVVDSVHVHNTYTPLLRAHPQHALFSGCLGGQLWCHTRPEHGG